MKKPRKYRLIIFLATFIVMMTAAVGVIVLFGYISNAMNPAEAGATITSTGTHPGTMADISQTIQPAEILQTSNDATGTTSVNASTSASAPVSPASSSSSKASTTAKHKLTIKTSAPAVVVAPIAPPNPDPAIVSLAFSLNGLSSMLSLFNNLLTTAPSAPTSTETSTSALATSTITVSTVTSTATTTAPATSTAPSSTVIAPLSTSSYLLYDKNNFSDMAGWMKDWGIASISSGSIEVAATADSSGGEIILPPLASNDPGDWKDYTFTATVDLMKRQTFALEARRQDSNNYLSCSFSNGGDIDIYLTENGMQYSLGYGKTDGFAFGQPATASIQVKGGQVTCSLNGAAIPQSTSYGLPPAMYSGGVGVLAWSPTLGAADILLEKAQVSLY